MAHLNGLRTEIICVFVSALKRIDFASKEFRDFFLEILKKI